MTVLATIPNRKRKPKRTPAPDAQGGQEREYPWPIISPRSCRHLDWYPLLAKGDADDDEYECEVCALCGTVRGVKPSKGRGQAPITKAVWIVKAAGGGYVDWKNDPRYRWITMRPQGEDGRGYPVLIRMDDASGGSGGGTIVGGAGGSMNYRRVTGVKKKGEYRTEARRKRREAEQRKEAKKQRQKEEARREGMDDTAIDTAEEYRAVALEMLQEEEQLAQAEHLAELQSILGWESPLLDETVAEGMSKKSRERIERERTRRLLKEAEKAERQVQEAVIEQHDRAVAAEIGTARVEDLACEEVDDSGMGYIAKISALAKENGLTEEDARGLSRAATDSSLLAAANEGYLQVDEDGNPMPLYGEEAAEAAENVRMRIDALQALAADAREEDKPHKEEGHHQPEAPLEMDPEEQKRLLLARERFKQKQRELQAKKREIEGAAPQEIIEVAKGDALVEIGRMTDEEAMKAVEDSLQARARIAAADELLTTVEELDGGMKSVEQQLLEGRHVQLEEVANAVFHQPLGMDRMVLDLLGPEAGGALMAHMMKQALGEEDVEAVREALREEHIATQVTKAREALEVAQGHFDAAKAAFAGFGTVGELGPEGLEAASAAKAEKLAELREARMILGTTLGRLQMLGAMNAALSEGTGRTLDVPLGQVGGAQAFQIAAALGLDRGEYEIQSDGPNKYINITRDAFGKLIDPPDPEQAALYEAAVAIKRGDFDEEDWLAEGLMRRPSEKYHDDPDFTEGWEVDAHEILDGQYGAGLEVGVREYAGRMLANGGTAGMETLRNRMLSAEWQADNLDEFQREQFADVVASVFPAEAASEGWASVGEELVKPFIEASNEKQQALDAQNIDVVSATDPIHRALQEVPEAKVAFTPLSRMSPQDKALIRDYFWKHLTDEEPPTATETREQSAALEEEGAEVVAQQVNIFGEVEEVTRGESESFQERAAAAETERTDHAWNRYVKAQRGVGNAYQTVQALIQGDLQNSFAKHYGRETGRGLRTAPVDLPNSLRHVIGLMPKDAMDRVLDADGGALREMYEGLRRRDAKGRYSQGEVSNLAAQILEKAKKMQLTLFADTEPQARRLSIGATAEKQLKQAWARVAPSFDPERPANIIENLSMTGRYVHQQRAVKMLEESKRIGLHFSTGSGKSLSALASFAQLKSQGKARRGLFLVPPKVQAQFGGEVNAYLEPGRFSHFSDPSATRDERRAVYADPDRDMVVVSHQAWRDDVTWAVAQDRFGGDEEAAADWLMSADRAKTSQAVQAAIDAQGWQADYTCIDEGHDTLNRKGKPDSRMARVIDATTDRAEYMMTMTATPVKNDPSEVYDLLRKVRPDKFPEGGYENFRRKYALNTEASREALQRLVAPYFYAKNVDTGVAERHYDVGVDVSPWQQERYRDVLTAYNEARKAPEKSDERREAIAQLVPEDRFEGMSDEQRTAKLDDYGNALGFVRDQAISRVLEHAPLEHNPRVQKIVELARRKATADDDGGQVPGLVFSQSLESVKLIADALKAEGFRVGVITGELAGNETELRRMDFNADAGRAEKGSDPAQHAATRRKMAKYDIIVGSGAAGTGLNMERARWLAHYDQPWTAKEVVQRDGRQNRLNQRWGEVEVHTLGVDVPYDRKRRELVERKRGLMSTFMEPTEQLDDTGLARRIRESRAERLTNATEAATGVTKPPRGTGGGSDMQEAAT